MTRTRHRHRILIIDDDDLFCEAVAAYLEEVAPVSIATTAARGLELAGARRHDVILLDQNLPDAEGSKVLAPLMDSSPEAKIIFVTAYPEVGHAVDVMKRGAYDYLTKPFEPDELQLLVRRALHAVDLERSEDLARWHHRSSKPAQGPVGLDQGLAHLEQLVTSAIQSEAPVLITGETGTGKSFLARMIHDGGARGDEPFVSVNCAALPEHLVEAELFGHAKGAFTGATGAKRGLFELAQGGTLFLDEIGAMPLGLQSKLLGVLDDGQVRRLGSERATTVDVRVIAATSSELEGDLDTGFRRDLYYRLAVLRLHLPPLRERRQDIPVLVDQLLAKHGSAADRIPPEELDALARYDWPGNIRELSNVLERALIIQRGAVLTPSELLHLGGPPAPQPPPGPTTTIEPLAEVERKHIVATLGALDGNLTRTARALGIALSTLKRKLDRYGLR